MTYTSNSDIPQKTQQSIRIESDLQRILKSSGHVFFETLLYIIYRDWLAKPGSTVLDIGAHTGTHTFRLAECVGERGRVLAFEPATSLAAGLLEECQKRYGTNQTRVQVLPMAVSEKSGVTVFRQNITRPSQSTIVQGHGIKDATTIETACGVVSIDSLFEALGTCYLSFVKIDAEGNEYRILDGARKTLTKMSPIIAMEFTLEQLKLIGRTPNDFQMLCQDLNYVFYNVNGLPFSCDIVPSSQRQSVCYEIFGAKRGHWGEEFLANKLPELVSRFLRHYAEQKRIHL
ncbi:MAG: FkbM family methyltransferase [Cyanobacteriota bacterium]|jgi:FkbM family methyltransferase